MSPTDSRDPSASDGPFPAGAPPGLAAEPSFHELATLLAVALEDGGGDLRETLSAVEASMGSRSLDLDAALVWWRLGLAWQRVGESANASRAFERAAEAYGDGGAEAEAADCYYAAGKAASVSGRHAGAIRAYRNAWKMFLAAGSPVESVRAQVAQAAELSRLGYSRAALRVYREARASLEAGDARVETATCLAGEARALADLGWVRDALEEYEKAGRSFGALKRWSEVARCRLDQATILLDLGQLAGCTTRAEEAAMLFSRLGDQLSLADCAVVRADALRTMGKPRESLAELQRVRDVFVAEKKWRRVAALDLRLGLAMHDAGSTVDAVAVLRQTGVVLTREDGKPGAAYCSLALGTALLALEQPLAAAEEFTSALQAFAESDALSAQVHALNGLAQTHEALGDDAAALDFYLQACGKLDQAMDRVGREDSDSAGLRGQLPDCFSPAIRILLRKAHARHISARQGPAVMDEVSEAFWLTERARSAGFRKELSYSLTTADVVALGADPDLVDRWHRLRARLGALDAAGRRRRRGPGALASSPADPESSLGNAAEGETRRRLLRQLDDVEGQLFRVLPAMSNLVSSRLPDPERVLELIREDEGLLIFHADRDDLICFLVCRDGVVDAEVIAGGLDAARVELSALAARVGECERSAGPGPRAGDWRPHLQRLGEILLPLSARAGWFTPDGPVRRLTVVPAAELHGLPFAAVGMPGEAAWLPLVSSIDVAVLPQASARYFLSLRAPRGHGTLGIIDPDSTLALGQREGDVLRRAVPGIELTVSGHPFAVTARTFPEVVRGFRNLHLSCHGVFEAGTPLESALVFAPERPEAVSSLLSARQLTSVPDRFELVVAAACESGESLVLQGEALLGLTRAFLYLARWVVSALWQINEHSTLALTDLMYRALSSEGDPVAALAQAQRILLDPTNPRRPDGTGLDLAHPYHWAGLVALG